MIWVVLFGAVGAYLMVNPSPEQKIVSATRQSQVKKGKLNPVVDGVVLVVTVLIVAGWHGVMWVLTGAYVVWGVWKLVSDQRNQTTLVKQRTEFARACTVFANQLRIGQVPTVALRQSAADCPVFVPVVAAVEVGADIGQAFREIGRQPGYQGANQLAMAWEMCAQSGAPISRVVDRIAESLRGEELCQKAILTELAAAKATSKLMAVLPVLGVILGFAAGGNPVTFLTQTLIGQICLILAISLSMSGLLWGARLANPKGAK